MAASVICLLVRVTVPYPTLPMPAQLPLLAWHDAAPLAAVVLGLHAVLHSCTYNLALMRVLMRVWRVYTAAGGCQGQASDQP